MLNVKRRIKSMKTSKEIKKELEKVDAVIKKHDARINELINNCYSWKEIYPGGRFKSEPDKEKQAHNKKIDELMNLENDAKRLAKIKRLYIINNLKYTHMAESMPVIIDVLKKYDGKQYGEKTAEKIAQEIEEKTGGKYARVSSHFNYCWELSFDDIPGGYDDIKVTMGTPWQEGNRAEIIDNLNTIHAPEALEMWNTCKYYENPVKAAKDGIKAWLKICKIQEELKQANKSYQNIKVEGLRDYDYIYPRILKDLVDC